MDISLIIMIWGLAGILPYQFFVLRKEAQEPPRFYVTWMDFIKSIPFGPVTMFAVFFGWCFFMFIRIIKKVLDKT